MFDKVSQIFKFYALNRRKPLRHTKRRKLLLVRYYGGQYCKAVDPLIFFLPLTMKGQR
jgi:hypothetical protein